MSHWVSVYCQKRITGFSPAVLEQEIRRGCKDYRGNDYFDDYFSFVKVKEYLRKPKDPGSSLYHLTYQVKDAQKRTDAGNGKIPIVLDRVMEPGEVEGMVKEQLEDYLKHRRGPKVALVRKHLAKVVEIYSFCMKQGHCDEEAGRIVVSIARQYIAQEGKGMVREDGIGWMKWTRRGLFEALKE